MNRKKILVLGGDGMVGHMIARYLSESGHDVHVTTRKDTTGNSKNHFLDISKDFHALDGIVEKFRPEFVINCVGILNSVAEENKSIAVLVNSFFPHYADELSLQYNFHLIHISTDCVFSGEKGGYSEFDVPDATSFYGKTKALGELNNDRNLTFRTSIVGPDLNEKGIGLFNWFIKQTGTVKGFSHVMWTGVTTLQLAKSIEKTFETQVSGLYHLVNNKKIDKYNLLLLFKKCTEKDIEIAMDTSYVSDKSLVCTRKDFDPCVPDYEDMVVEMNQWIQAHGDMYEDILLNIKK